MIEPVYILIRTSGRPLFFARMMETIKKQTYKNIVTIVHSDDPRDEYVTGDIIINGTAFGLEYGNGAYNLYNNRLLNAIPSDKPGWYHFIDDDDEYASNDVIEKLVKLSKKDHINVAKVKRWNETIWPKNWGIQKSYQTECFFIHTNYKSNAKWWGNKGGDHHYSKQLTKILPINWIEDLLICNAQEGKGHGKRLDKNCKTPDYYDKIDKNLKVVVLGLIRNMSGPRCEWIRQGELKRVKYSIALKLESMGKAKITNWCVYREKAPAKNIYNL